MTAEYAVALGNRHAATVRELLYRQGLDRTVAVEVESHGKEDHGEDAGFKDRPRVHLSPTGCQALYGKAGR